MSATEKRPKLVVFDLDCTLWPFWVDTHVDPPFYKDGGKVYDQRRKLIKPFPEVPHVLEKLHSDGYELAIASRTGEIEGANQLVSLFGWDKYFKYKQIYPGCKINHFNQFHKASGYKLDDMLFFDDESRNIHDLSPKGVTCILVGQKGVTMKLVDDALQKFAAKK